MKRIVSSILVCLVAMTASAQQFRAGELWYEVTGKKTVQVLADPTDTTYRQMTEIIVPETVAYEGQQYKVTRLDDHAFGACHFLRHIQLPDGLREIGFQAFMNCTQLTEIRLPKDLRMIDEMAFYGCVSLETVYVGKRLKRWSDMCFSDCSRLQTIYHAGGRPPKTHKMSFFNCPEQITYYRLR